MWHGMNMRLWLSHHGLAPSGGPRPAWWYGCMFFALTTQWLSHMHSHCIWTCMSALDNLCRNSDVACNNAGSPEMRVRTLDAETKRMGTINTGSKNDGSKIKAHTVRPRIASEEDTPMSPSTVKARGYWTNTAGPRLRPSETGTMR